MNRKRSLPSLCLAMCLVAAPSSSSAKGLSTQTFEACSETSALTQAVDELSRIGWEEISEPSTSAFLEYLADGAMISMRDLRAPLDWQAAQEDAADFASTVVRADTAMHGGSFIHKEGAALVIADRSDGVFTGFQCVYSGPADEEFERMFDALERMDERVGVERGDPSVQAYSMQSQRTYEDSYGQIDLQAARFDGNVHAMLGRDANVEMGFSLFSFSWTEEQR